MKKLIGYVLQRSECNGSVFVGCTPESVSLALAEEIRSEIDEGLSVDERCVITLTPREFTQEELDTMPDFEGW